MEALITKDSKLERYVAQVVTWGSKCEPTWSFKMKKFNAEFGATSIVIGPGVFRLRPPRPIPTANLNPS